jgi:hypothetical protein
MKRQLVLPGFIVFVILSFLTQCDTTKTCPECFTPPEIFRLRLIDKIHSTDLISSGYFNKDSIRMYYFDKNVRKDIEIELHTDSASNKTILYSNEIGWISISGFKEYFLKLDSVDTDTLYVDVVKKVEDCCTFHPYKAFKYNGLAVEMDNLEFDYIIKK